MLKQKELQDENRVEDEATTGVARPRKLTTMLAT